MACFQNKPIKKCTENLELDMAYWKNAHFIWSGVGVWLVGCSGSGTWNILQSKNFQIGRYIHQQVSFGIQNLNSFKKLK
jgi:hypothetical protein